MELMDCDLQTYLGDRTWEEVAKCSVKDSFCLLLRGIETMHQEGMTHRDIKPQASASQNLWSRCMQSGSTDIFELDY